MLSEENKYLTVLKGVVLNEKIDLVIYTIDKYFSEYPRKITSAVRDKASQLRIIIEDANYEHIPVPFIQGDADKKDDNGDYVWLYAWRALLDKGYKINPPCIAIYQNRIINPSTHILGTAFDIGAEDGKALDTVAGIINYIMATEKNLIYSYCAEAVNHCFHVNIKD